MKRYLLLVLLVLVFVLFLVSCNETIQTDSLQKTSVQIHLDTSDSTILDTAIIATTINGIPSFTTPNINTSFVTRTYGTIEYYTQTTSIETIIETIEQTETESIETIVSEQFETEVTNTTVSEQFETKTTETITSTETETIITNTSSYKQTETTLDVTSSCEQTETSIEETTIEHYYIKTMPSSDSSTKYYKYKNRLYIIGSHSRYYDRYNDQFLELCLDPLCDHTQNTCILVKFYAMFHGVYNTYNERIYVPSGDNLYSFKSSGIDLRLEVSFSDFGKITDDGMYMGGTYLNTLTYFDEYLFFVHSEVVDNALQSKLYKYNTETKKLTQLSNESYNVSNICILGEDLMAIPGSCFGQKDVYYIFDFNFNLIRIIEDSDLIIADHLSTFDENNIYIQKNNSIISYDKKTFAKRILVETDKMVNILDVDGGYVYYTLNDPFYVGTQEVHGGKMVDVFNSYHTIYRVSDKGGDIELVYEGLTSQNRMEPSFQVGKVVVFGDRVFITGHIIKNNYDLQIQQKTTELICKLENGKIIME